MNGRSGGQIAAALGACASCSGRFGEVIFGKA
jgi:hypothetical protein